MNEKIFVDESLNKFYELLDEIKEADEALTIDIEPMLENLLDFVIAHPDLRLMFADAFVRILYCWHMAPPQITEYCMHALRWEEVKRTLEGRNKVALTKREEFFIARVLDCFDDDWDSAYQYRRFQKQ